MNASAAAFDAIRAECRRLGFADGSYSVGGSPAAGFGEPGIDFRDGKWAVFFTERGHEEDLARFDTKRSALRYFFLMSCLTKGSGDYPAVDWKNLRQAKGAWRRS